MVKSWQWVKVENGVPDGFLHLHDSMQNAGIDLNAEDCEYELEAATAMYDRNFEQSLGFYERIADPKIEKVDGIWTVVNQKTEYTGQELLFKKNEVRELFLAMVEKEKEVSVYLMENETDEIKVNAWKKRIEDLENYEHNEADPKMPDMPEELKNDS